MAKKVSAKDSPYYSNLVGGAKFTLGAEAANVRKVTVQLLDANNRSLAVRGSCKFYLSDDTNGDTLTATAPSGGIAIATNGVCIESIADKFGILISEANGLVDINITEVGVKSFYLILIMPDGRLLSSGAIAFV